MENLSTFYTSYTSLYKQKEWIEMKERKRVKYGEKGGGREISQSTESQGREEREGCSFVLLSLVKVTDNLAAALVFMSGMAPHP